MAIKGVDVSRWQGDIDWAKLAADGVLWAGIRASVGNYYTDRTFEFNYDGAWDVGILPFPYHVINPNNTVESQLARYKLSLGGRKPVMTVVDAELVGSVTDMIRRRRYCWFIRDGKRDPDFGSQWILYSNKNFMEGHMKNGYMAWVWSENIPFWVASYGANDGTLPPTPPYPRLPFQYEDHEAWQYTDKGKLANGSSLDLDEMKDRFYRNLRIRSGLAEPGATVPVPIPDPEHVTVLQSGLYRVE